jgi:DnaJ-class molecular chaperone
MADDYYKVLDVPRSATQDEIQKAYRKLARKYHPDLQSESKDAKKKFQQVQQAYDVLGDEEKRKQYDRFGPNFEQMRGAGPGSPFGGGPGGGPFGGGEVDFSQIFGGQRGAPGGVPGGGGIEEFLRGFGMGGGRAAPGGRHPQPGPPQPPPNLDIEQKITIPFGMSVTGGEYRVHVDLGSGKPESLSTRIPVGIESGKKIRLRGQGRMGPDGSRGDLLVVVNVAPHPVYRRMGNNLLVKLPVTISESIRGTQIDLPTPHGTISLKVPAACSSGRVLRLKGMGVRPDKQPHGDLLAEVEILVPQDLSESELKELAGALQKLEVDDPRADLSW